MTEPRCVKCGQKLAEKVDGPAVITCRRCKTVNQIEANLTIRECPEWPNE